MPLFRLSEKIDFPPAWLARSDGLLCIGGDLSPQRLILAYENGIFPWFSDQEPILWWSPNPRLVLCPSGIRISRSLKKKIRKHPFTIRINTAFEQTILACSAPRGASQDGTWLVEEMIEAYINLHKMGMAHSIEAWQGQTLVGGLYGVSLGTAFFGESMFCRKPDASKMALVALARHLDRYHFNLIDCQVTTDHLVRMGAKEMSRDTFLDILNTCTQENVPQDVWEPGQYIDLAPEIT
ncbi:MAG: leucyl/phenylalanyl-tRNA--protein transferase [Desulfobacter sp.]|nr:leucyl/phenylalanyl-tRNA--protein transferase [Desulfobacter sp.]WDP85996.1 MAG: leucyl/phenylalanyl-tRNA--protein transferase [Desulfobacter sp.]